jgi:hypothetical protein
MDCMWQHRYGRGPSQDRQFAVMAASVTLLLDVLSAGTGEGHTWACTLLLLHILNTDVPRVTLEENSRFQTVSYKLYTNTSTGHTGPLAKGSH